jgi:hypothetical protein
MGLGAFSMHTPSEQAQIFLHRAKELEQRAARENDQKLKETLLILAGHYCKLAEQSKSGPY